MQLPRIDNSAQLHQFIRDTFDLHLPRRRVCPGHDSPMDFIWQSFSTSQDLLAWSCRGGGKSFAAALATTLGAMFVPGSTHVILGGSQQQSDRVAEHVHGLLERVSDWLHRDSRRREIRLVNDSAISVLAQSQTSVRGIHADRVRCDEVELFDPAVWRAVAFCTTGRTAQRGCLDVLSTAHVPGGIMEGLIDRASGQASRAWPGRLVKWCLWEVIERCPPERACQSCPLADDCRGVAREGEGFFKIDDAIAISARSSRLAWETEMLCRGASREGLVFAEFNPDLHVGPVEYQPQWPTFRAIDFGYAAPLVCLWIQLAPGGAVHVIDEYVQARRSLDRHAVEIAGRYHNQAEATFVDPAGNARESTSGEACTEMLAKHGIPCTWRASSIVEGLELVRSHLAPAEGPPALKISPKCKALITSLKSYHYPDTGGWTANEALAAAAGGSGGASENPVKDGPDHLIDALRYFFVNRGRPRLKVWRRAY